MKLVEYTLETPPDRIVFDQYIPKVKEIQYLADQMVRFHLLKKNDIKGLVDDQFAKEARVDGVTDFHSILNPPDQ